MARGFSVNCWPKISRGVSFPTLPFWRAGGKRACSAAGLIYIFASLGGGLALGTLGYWPEECTGFNQFCNTRLVDEDGGGAGVFGTDGVRRLLSLSRL